MDIFIMSIYVHFFEKVGAHRWNAVRCRRHVICFRHIYKLLQCATRWAIGTLQVNHSRRLGWAAHTKRFVDQRVAFVTESLRHRARGGLHRAGPLKAELCNEVREGDIASRRLLLQLCPPITLRKPDWRGWAGQCVRVILVADAERAVGRPYR